jgi:hypothetical protein
VRTFVQSSPVVPPLIQFPFSEIGFFVPGKFEVQVLVAGGVGLGVGAGVGIGVGEGVGV